MSLDHDEVLAVAIWTVTYYVIIRVLLGCF